MRHFFIILVLAVIAQQQSTTLPCCPTAFACKDKVTVKPQEQTKVIYSHVPYPVFREHSEKTFECPKDFTKVNENTCLHKIHKVEKRCPPRYFRISDETCVRIITIPPKHPFFKYECPEGYSHYAELGCQIGKEHEKKISSLTKNN